jgi:hypothetical protein
MSLGSSNQIPASAMQEFSMADRDEKSNVISDLNKPSSEAFLHHVTIVRASEREGVTQKSINGMKLETEEELDVLSQGPVKYHANKSTYDPAIAGLETETKSYSNSC